MEYEDWDFDTVMFLIGYVPPEMVNAPNIRHDVEDGKYDYATIASIMREWQERWGGLECPLLDYLGIEG